MGKELNIQPRIEDGFRDEFVKNLGKLNEEGVRETMYAFDFARWIHGDQERMSGNNYFEEHVVGVAQILLNEVYISDPIIISGALLHDVIEDGNLFRRIKANSYAEKMAMADEMLGEFGFSEPVREIAIALSKPELSEEFPTERARMKKAAHNLIWASPGAQLVKLADKVHNARTIGPLPRGRQDGILLETTEVFIPIFEKLLIPRYPAEGRYLVDKLNDQICEIYAQRSI